MTRATEEGRGSRIDGRAPGDLREISILRGCSRFAEGSALVDFGATRVLCTASVEEKVPLFLRGSGKGWVTAEYSMLPRSTEIRTPRDSVRGGISGRSHEIQRLIGRSLRAGTALELLGERTVWIDCDVLQADGGTRTAAITGGFVALVDALRWLFARRCVDTIPLKCFVAALSVGKVDGEIVADLCYGEDSRAEVDFNIVMNEFGDFIEVQGTAEGEVFSRKELVEMLDLAGSGISSLIDIQKSALGFTGEEERELAVARDRIRQLEQK
ncbi:MAG TPA: ribonuclease PH [Synergistales bacterium]|nr:ribonuclease PH [Synergistales bacterium]